MNSNKQLYYIHDPMCSWCWGFAKTWSQVKSNIPSDTKITYVLGGLAPDSSEPMPESMREYVQLNWQNVAKKIPGTEFNYRFWSECNPVRSTYPSCRAVIATKNQNKELEYNMIQKIQHGYYLQAKNPSEEETLVQFADELGLDTETFKNDLNSNETNDKLMNEILMSESLPINGFPSLVLKTKNGIKRIHIDYNDHESIINQICT
jgi:putative protein-disulfide isomerase